MDIEKIIEEQKLELTRKLELLTSNNLTQLLEEKRALKEKLSEVDAKISQLGSQLGIDVGDEAKADKKERGSRMSSTDIRKRILAILSSNPDGLGQKQISDLSGVSYPSVINFIKDNASILTATGKLKTKKIFLKAEALAE
jgi:cell division septum initiation protein DivIVA